MAGRTFGDIAVEMGVDRRTVAKWVALDDLPDRQRSTIKPSSPLYFQEFLERRWAAGDRSGRRLFHDVRNRGYIGSFSHLERLLSTWRKGAPPGQTPSPPSQPPPAKVEPLGETPAIDPTTGWQISPMVGATRPPLSRPPTICQSTPCGSVTLTVTCSIRAWPGRSFAASAQKGPFWCALIAWLAGVAPERRPMRPRPWPKRSRPFSAAGSAPAARRSKGASKGHDDAKRGLGAKATGSEGIYACCRDVPRPRGGRRPRNP